jgi:hypothetical protein
MNRLDVDDSILIDLRFVGCYYSLPEDILVRLEEYVPECFPPYEMVHNRIPDLEYHIYRELVLSCWDEDDMKALAL